MKRAQSVTAMTGSANFHESDQERSNREWAENWNVVTGEPDLNTLSTGALLRARNFGNHRIMLEHYKAQRGQLWAGSLVDSIRTELYAIDQVLRARASRSVPLAFLDASEESVSLPDYAVAEVDAPRG
jgi:hypothetical protein